jgi:hypothetical protein
LEFDFETDYLKLKKVNPSKINLELHSKVLNKLFEMLDKHYLKDPSLLNHAQQLLKEY